MKQIPLFKHIMAHLDDKLRYTEKTLPDNPSPTLPHPLGSGDAYFYTRGSLPDSKSANNMAKLVRRYLADPSLSNKQAIYQKLDRVIPALICTSMAEEIDAEELGEVGYSLARTMFYNATKSEQLMFAYILFGIYGMEKIMNSDKKLWEDLVTIAHCEEFTFSFIFACGCKEFIPQNELWEIAECTSGWGKVFAINELQCEDEDDQLWLLEKGYDLDIEYTPLSIKLVELTNINHFLAQESLERDTYTGAGNIINNLLLMLYEYTDETLGENLSDISLDCNRMISSYLRHSVERADNPEDLLQVIGISIGLSNLIQTQRYFLLTPNEAQALLAEAQRIICLNDWKSYVEAHLFTESEAGEEGQPNYTVCDLGSELEIDIWPRLMEYYLVHPMETQLFPYLLGSTPERLDMTLLAITNHLDLYYGEREALLFPLRYLRNFPGKGETLVHAALCSMHDLPRGIACALLDEWGPDYLTDYLRNGLREGLRLSSSSILQIRINTLLQGKRFHVSNPENEPKYKFI